MPGAFQPKFVDLVRNTTTTVGTGNFTLGPAVTGYTSFTAALQVGDTFYYSAIGIDKPAEREVGRGTLLGNGMISRSAISGTNTNFTTGTKSVALIAAAEWYQLAQQVVTSISAFGQSLTSASSSASARATLGVGSAGQELVSRFPVTLADRPTLAGYSATSTAYLREPGREGLFVWDPSDRSANVAADAGQGIYVAGASNPSGASGAWVRKFSAPVNVKWFGAVGDGSTDDSAAFTSAIAYLKAAAINSSGYYRASDRLFVPGGHYFLGTTTLDLTHTLIIEGDGTGMAGTVYPAKLRWAAGTTGFRIQRYDTSGVSSVDNANTHTGGDGCVLRGLHLVGAYSGTEAEAHGVHVKARVGIERCKIENFQGDGIYGVATAGSGAPNEGNANISRVVGCSISGCRNGMFLDGADTNIWSIIAVDASSNRRWGIWDSSFLGNSYFGCHCEANAWITGAPAAVVSYSGNRYCVKKDQGAGASTNAPSGTSADNSWWYYMGAGAAAPLLNINLWTSGTVYRDGGSYRSDGEGNANNLFSGCYHEGGQAFAQIDAPSLVDGGSMRPNVKGVGYLCGSSMRGGAIAITGAFGVSDNVQAQGPQMDFGPVTGAQDLVFNLNSTGTEVGLWAWISGALKGYIRNVGGAWYYNAVSAHNWRINGSDTAQLDSTGLGISVPVAASAAITTTSGGIGYAAGAGGTVTQQTSKSTAVTLNKVCGQIMTNGAALAANAAASFVVNNNQVAATDTVSLVLASGNATASSYTYQVDKVSAGSFSVTVRNVSAAALSESLVFNFAVQKAVAA